MKLIRKFPVIPAIVILHRVTLTFAMAMILFMSGVAFAQVDAGTPDENFVDGAVKVIGDTSSSIREVAQNPKSPKILIVLIVLMGVAQLVKRIGRKLPVFKGFALGAWMDNHWWADWVVSIVISIGGAVVTSLSGGGSIDVGLIVSAIVMGMAGAGFGPGAPKPSAVAAQDAGAAAAADPSKTLNG